jgi:hypothetical protein
VKSIREAWRKELRKKIGSTLPDQIEDILRRSTYKSKTKRKALLKIKMDDKLVGLFSRKNTGPKAKSKKKKFEKERKEEYEQIN